MEKKTTCSGTFEKIRTLNITITAYISQVLMSQSNYRLAITICSLPLSTKCVICKISIQPYNPDVHTVKLAFGSRVKKHFNSLAVSLSLGPEGTSICFLYEVFDKVPLDV